MGGSEILSRFLKNEGLTCNKLARIVGISVSILYDIKKGRIKNITPQNADKILEFFPQYSRVWLTIGKGGMYKDDDNFHVQNNSEDVSKEDLIRLETAYKLLDIRYQQLLDMNAKLVEQNSKLFNIIDKIPLK